MMDGGPDVCGECVCRGVSAARESRVCAFLEIRCVVPHACLRVRGGATSGPPESSDFGGEMDCKIGVCDPSRPRWYVFLCQR